MYWTALVNSAFLKRQFLVYFVNSWYSFWKWPSLISNPLRILWVILRQSPKGTIVFFQRQLWIGVMFPWLPESQAPVPFQTLPSSYLKTTFLKPEQSLPSPQREKWGRLITSLRVADRGLFIWGYIFRHRNTAPLTMTEKQNGLRSHGYSWDGASASSTRTESQSSWWPAASLKGVALEKMLACCFPDVVYVSALLSYSEGPLVRKGASLILPLPQAAEAGESTPPMVLVGHRGSTYYWTPGTQLPPKKQT